MIIMTLVKQGSSGGNEILRPANVEEVNGKFICTEVPKMVDNPNPDRQGAKTLAFVCGSCSSIQVVLIGCILDVMVEDHEHQITLSV